MPISIPVIDMVEIGAGGGSLASVDSMRQIRVGPQSAGSSPGPACYNRGGEHPAVTDADLILGRLDAASFAGGSMPLSVDAAHAALGAHIGTSLKMDGVTAAYGISEVVDENMANAARVHAVENGEDLASYAMIAFGGAAPLHAGRLCEKLAIDRLIVPPGAGVGSAIGFLRAPFSFEATRSTYMRLSDFDSTRVSDLFDSLKSEAETFVRSCDADAPISSQFRSFMRYVGQGWEIPVDLEASDAAAPDQERFQALFETAYRGLFGRTVDGLDIEIASWSVNATTPPAPVSRSVSVSPGAQTPATAQGQRSLFDKRSNSMVSVDVYERHGLTTGATLSGPAIITESETTIIVPTGFGAVLQADGCLDIQRTQPTNQEAKS